MFASPCASEQNEKNEPLFFVELWWAEGGAGPCERPEPASSRAGIDTSPAHSCDNLGEKKEENTSLAFFWCRRPWTPAGFIRVIRAKPDTTACGLGLQWLSEQAEV